MLKIDLLPAHFATARTNKKLIAVGVVVLLACLIAWGFMIMTLSKQIGDTQAQLDDMKTKADAVRDIDAKTQAKQAELQPIADKVNFINAADKSGAEFWDRFNKINRWLGKTPVHSFTITPPDSVTFTCTVGDTTECARFVLNLLRCPFIQKPIQVSGLPKGLDVKGVGGATGGGGAGGGAGGPGGPGMGGGMPGGGPGGMPGGPGGPGMGGGMPGMAGGPGGMPGGGPGGPGGPGMGGGMPGMAGGAPGGGAPGAGGGGGAGGAAFGPINLSVTCRLVEAINIPKPPGAAAAGGGMAGMGGGMAGMGAGMPGGGMPGAPPGAAPGGAPKGAATKGGGSKADDSGGGKKGKASGGED